jgi:hypothetical protein
MDDRPTLLDRIAKLEATVARLVAANAELRQRLAERDARIAELEQELARRSKNYRPKDNAAPRKSGKQDRRKRRFRKHPGVFRPPPTPDENTIQHEVHLSECPQCGSADLQATGHVDEHLVVDIPEPKPELHCFRRHEYHCPHCARSFQGRGDLELPGAHLGPRLRALVCYSRAYLGISLEKTCTLLSDLFGVSLSRAGALGHLRWGSRLTAPVVEQLLALLRQAPLVQGDETGWRINGKNVWAWCFRNPQIAVFLIDRRRSSQVLIEALGESPAGVLVSDFYAAYNCLTCPKHRSAALRTRFTRCARSLVAAVQSFVQPLITFLQDAIALGQRRETLLASAFEKQRLEIKVRFIEILLECESSHPDCRRIWKRLHRHADELLTFLEVPGVPSDNNGGERDIRSVAAARGDGGTNRSEWGARAFANLKTVVRTCQKNGLGFFDYMLRLVKASLGHEHLPLPLEKDSPAAPATG